MPQTLRTLLALGLTTATLALVALVAANPPAVQAAPADYGETQVSNGGTVSGRVHFDDEVPPPDSIQPDRDADTCGVRIPKEEFVVDESSKGLANAVVQIKGIAAGKSFDTTEGKIEQLKCRYQPRIVVLRPGQTLSIINHDPVLHNVHAYLGDDTVFNLAQPFQGQTTAKKLEEEGVVRVACDVHSWMEAWVLVIDSPYFAITDSSGGFSISDVPPGDYTITMWHEVLGSGEKTVTVPADGESTVDFVIGG